MFRYMLAPLEDHSDTALRRLCSNHGADLTFTEMAKVDSLANNVKSAIDNTQCKDNTPTQIQLLPAKDEELAKYLKHFSPRKGFMGFNFNFGCPDPQIQKTGRGCAMVKNPEKAKRIISIVRGHGYPVSIKLRLGANAAEKKSKVYLKLINNSDPDFFIVHARTGDETYNDRPDYSVFEECADTGKEIVANGDIETNKAVQQIRSAGVKGIMIGRAAVRNPAIFDHLKGKKTPSFDELKEEYEALSAKYATDERHKKNVLKRIGQAFVPSYHESKM